jgi:hypothetical protein
MRFSDSAGFLLAKVHEHEQAHRTGLYQIQTDASALLKAALDCPGVRPLTGLEPEQQREVWEKALKTALPSSTPGGRAKAVLNKGDEDLIASSTHLRILLDSFLSPCKDQPYANSPQYLHSP